MVVTMFLTTLAFAQNANLQVNRIMDGKIVPLDRMVVTKVRGRALSRYKLSYYRSARFEATAAERGLCAHAVDADKGGGDGAIVVNREKGSPRVTSRGKVRAGLD